MNGILDNLKWEKVDVTNIFEIKKCSNGYKTSQLKPGDIPYVSRSNVNNGITRYVSNKEKPLYPANSLTIHHEWKKFYVCFFQEKKFTTDGMIYYMRRKDKKELDKWAALFICCILNNTYAIFKSDRKCGLSFVKIELPHKNGEIAWQEMSEYMKNVSSLIDIKIK